jgi:hypothetical protein
MPAVKDGAKDRNKCFKRQEAKIASIDDILTVLKNVVVAINGWNSTTRKNAGTATSVTVTTATVIATGNGRLVNFSVLVAGSTNGFVYNALSTTVTASQALAVAPNTIGNYTNGSNYTVGLVVVPGTGQSINITYSPN